MPSSATFSEFAAAFPWFLPAFAFVVGACVGSFLNVVIYRVPKDESIVSPGSHCGCGAPIKWYDNIPILSWLVLRGRARCCGRRFSVRHPVIELLTGLLFLACFAKFPPGVAVCGVVFLSALVGATFIDFDHFIIPDVFTIGLAVLGVALSFAVPALQGQNTGLYLADSLRAGFGSVVGILIGSAGVLWLALIGETLLRKEAMGFGDVKFVGAIGAFCGWRGAVFSVFGGAVVFTFWFATAWVWEKISGRRPAIALPSKNPDGTPGALAFGMHIPFGPMLAIAGAIYFLVLRDSFDERIADLIWLF
jgi:leader peptidase (prepilin peptidase)/N-methyltransferase